MSNNNNNTLQAYTPGSDIAAAFQPYQINWGRTGNDILIGYNTLSDPQNSSTIDILVGDIEIPLLVDPYPRNWQNKYILGDWKQLYYANGNPSLLGLNDFAIIIDFEPNQDIIQLHGQASDYQTFEFSLGTVVWHKEILPEVAVPDVVAFIPITGLALNANYFQYTGYTPAAPSLTQAKQIGTAGFELGNSITVDKNGYVYVAGGTSGSLGGQNQGNRDIWFAKYDRQGNDIWRKQIGSNSFDFPFGIGVDGQGNVYLAGSTQGDLGNSLYSDTDAWVAKFDNNGDPLWLKQFGNGDYSAHATYALDIDFKGNISISGVSVKNTPEGSPLPTTADAWVARYDTNGNQQWFRQFGTPNDPTAFDESYAIALDKRGNIFTSGFTTGAIGSSIYNGLYDAWLAKNDRNGNQLWAKNIGSADYDWAWGVDTNSKGSVYVTGWTLGNLGGTNAGSFDAWLAKFDRYGNQKWVRQFGTSGDDEAFGIKVDNHDNIYVTGYTDDAFTGKTNEGELDAWVVKYDRRGTQKWVQQFGSAGTDQALDITVSGNNVHITGLTDGSFNTDNQGSFDGWVAKLNGKNGKMKNFTGTLDSGIQPKKSGSEIINLAHQPGQPSQSPTSQKVELFTSVPKDIALAQLDTDAIAQVFQTSPEALANYSSSSLQNAFSANLTPYSGVGATSLDLNNQSLTQFSDALLLPSSQSSIFSV